MAGPTATEAPRRNGFTGSSTLVGGEEMLSAEWAAAVPLGEQA
ncbi:MULTISPECIES: hypothetical protein [Streptosporangium]|uniref:Uncharacterized protein n=1 Tax=Streptosporangium brasiliense TaxID=47480 RepID=A0ABT9RIV7_9ACTN|nr:hypothetical protein [Streptosporangium brasiliense]MDP9869190.1 hypothetical protein [Streptosporangium brasiliense]